MLLFHIVHLPRAPELYLVILIRMETARRRDTSMVIRMETARRRDTSMFIRMETAKRRDTGKWPVQ